jgi:hypothetical protein
MVAPFSISTRKGAQKSFGRRKAGQTSNLQPHPRLHEVGQREGCRFAWGVGEGKRVVKQIHTQTLETGERGRRDFAQIHRCLG